MELKIYNQNGELKLTASTASSSTWNMELMREDAVSAAFTHPFYVPLDVNDYVMLEGVKFSIKKEYKPKQKNMQAYSYSVKFYAPIHDAEQVMYLNLTDGAYEPQFALDGSPREHLQKWVENMNRIYGREVWSMGDVVVSANQTIEYNNLTCWDALASMAEAFETEWWADGFTMNLSRCERGERVELGYLQGLTSLIQTENSDDVKFFTRLIPLGSTKNIDASRYGFSRLQLPDKAKYVDRNTQYGLYEHVEEAAFAEIFPHYTGTVSEVRAEEKTGDDEKPFTVYYFKDSGMAFDPCENEIGGLVKHVSFQTGDLAGRDFEANYNSETKEWEIINTYPDDETQIPGGNLISRIGDKYIPWNFRMPVEYETQAEQDYKAAVDDFLKKYSDDIAIYGGETDYIHIDKNSVPLMLGQNVRLMSAEYFGEVGYRDSRMTKVVRKLDNLSVATIECTNQVGKGWKTQVESSISQLKYIVGEKWEQAMLEVLKTWDIKEPSNYNVFSSLRSRAEFLSKKYPDETRYLMKFLAGIHAGEFSQGSKGAGIYQDDDGNWHIESDYLHVRMKFTAKEVEIQRTTHIGGAQMKTAAAMTCIRVEELADVYRCYMQTEDSEGNTIHNEFRVQDQGLVETFNLVKQADGTIGNHFLWRLVTAVGDDYIDLSKSVAAIGSDAPQVGDRVVQLGYRGTDDPNRQTATIDAGAGEGAPYYRQYVGINSFSWPEPETQLKPGDNILSGRLHIQPGTTGWRNADGLPEEIQAAADAASAAQSAADEAMEAAGSNAAFIVGISSELESVKNQLDGVIETWFYDPEPTLDNEPATNWATDDDKNVHLGDLYYDAKGKSYRFQLKNGAYSWAIIEDTDVSKALETAKKAQDTADGKRRIFVSQPTADHVYDEGDLWVNATYGTAYNNDLLSCNKAKISGEMFDISHWGLASKYTDDTVANEAKRIADNAKERLNTWAADGVISPTEKTALKQELKNLSAEYDSILLDCSKFGISSTEQVRVDFTSAFNAYKSELEYHSVYEPENISIRGTFSSSQSAFYISRTAIVSEISARSKSYADGLFEDMTIGKMNMLLNSGFTGDYNSAYLDDASSLKDGTELYSSSTKYWTVTSATVTENTNSASGHAIDLCNGSLSQILYYKLIKDENYVFSVRASGTTISVSVGGASQTWALTGLPEKLVMKFVATGNTDIVISGTCMLYEPQLERGTIETEWGPSALDNNSLEAKMEALRYMTDVIKNGSVDMLGGLILASMLQLGNYVDSKMKEVTAGVSGVYNNGDDVAFWAGGTLEQAIKAVMLFKDNPNYEPTAEELQGLAKAVITHSGRAVLNDVILRGYVYAIGGLFKGTVDAANGKTHFDADGTGWIGKLAEKYFAKWDESGNGSLCFENILWDNAKKLLTVIGKVEAKEGSKIGNLEVTPSGMMIGTNIIFENCASGYNWTWGPNGAEKMRTLLIDNIGKSSSFQLVFSTSGGTYPVVLPNYNEISNAAGRMVDGGFELKLFVPVKWGLTSSIENNSTFRITSQEHANLYNNDGAKMDYIDLSKGDFLELYGLVSLDPIEGTVAGHYCIDYYIKSLRQ